MQYLAYSVFIVKLEQQMWTELGLESQPARPTNLYMINLTIKLTPYSYDI